MRPVSQFMRKWLLVAHVSGSVGWIGAVAAFLVLSIAGLMSADADIVRSSYLSMNLIGQFVIVPLSFLALFTGVVQALGTPWGLFRYYWILVKFALTIGATSVLLLHQFTAVTEAAKRVSGFPSGELPNVGRLGPQLVGDAVFAIVVLIAITVISIFKPWGKTRYGQVVLNEAQTSVGITPSIPLKIKILLIIIGLLAIAFVSLHLADKGLGGHAQ